MGAFRKFGEQSPIDQLKSVYEDWSCMNAANDSRKFPQ